MKIFISHKFRGANKKELRKELENIAIALEKAGHKTFIYYRDKENWQPQNFPFGKVINEAFQEIKKCDAILCFIHHKKVSEGVLLELGYAMAHKKKLILLISRDCPFPTIEAISDKVIWFKNELSRPKKQCILSGEFFRWLSSPSFTAEDSRHRNKKEISQKISKIKIREY